MLDQFRIRNHYLHYHKLILELSFPNLVTGSVREIFGTFLLVRPHEKLLGLLGLGLRLTLMITLALIALTIIFRGGLTGKYQIFIWKNKADFFSSQNGEKN